MGQQVLGKPDPLAEEPVIWCHAHGVGECPDEVAGRQSTTMRDIGDRYRLGKIPAHEFLGQIFLPWREAWAGACSVIPPRETSGR